jgi:hypothetical protein
LLEAAVARNAFTEARELRDRLQQFEVRVMGLRREKRERQVADN